MPEWTLQQQQAINSPSRKIVCSAAAGSGKTAVMVERIVRMLREGADPESFLVVTFTNAAAAEMKQKIRDRLRQGRSEKNLRRAYEKIDMMEISTIHSFCQHLIREEFQAAGVDPFFAVCEPARAKKLFSDAFHDACTELQEVSDADYTRWKQCFSRKDTEEIVRTVHAFMMSLPDPFGWLDRACDDVPLHVDPGHPWFETASKIVRERIARARVILRRQFEMFSEPEHGEPYREAWKADSELFHVKQLWAEGKEITAEQRAAGFSRLPSWTKLNRLEEDWKERYQAYRDQLKEIMKEIGPLLDPDPDVVERDFGNMRASLQGLKKITRLASELFAKKKASLRVLDFGDLEHFALKILSAEPVGSAVRGRYREVFVDECQDVSRVQDRIIQLLYSPAGHLFMVGDVKQSIYRFRLADPGLFLGRMREYGREGSDGELLELQANFRSVPEILDTANVVFRDIMREETAELDYTPREELLPGRMPEGFHPVRVELVPPDAEKTRLECTADYFAARAAELRAEGFSWRDLVILMPKVSGDGQKLAELLEERKVPVFFDGGADFYEREEVSAFLDLLNLVADPAADGPLLSVLKNAPFFFSDQELAEIRLENDGKDVPFREAFRVCLEDPGEIGARCREAQERIGSWRKMASVVRMSDFVRFLCSDSQRFAAAGAGPEGHTAQQNLRILCRKAEEAEKGGVWSLRRFLSYVSEQAGGGDQASAVSLSPEDDVVRIMTMHKSKGLQFPVVFCLGLENPIEHKARGSVLADAELGICLKYKRPEYRVSRNTAAYTIFCWKKETEERAERIRLLYVAMTRAQKRMFLAGVRDAEDDVLWKAPAGIHRVLAAGDYLDWIMPALRDASKLSTGYAQGETPWKITVFDDNQQQTVEKEANNPHFEEWLDSLLSAGPVDGLWKDLKEEPYTSRMKKRSVTSLLKQAEQEIGLEEEEEETPEGKRIPERFTEALKRLETGRLPAFMNPPEEKRGAWRGTVVHRFLSLADLQQVREAGGNTAEALRKIKQKMLEDGVFTPEEGAAIRPEDAAAYMESALGRRMLASEEVHREWGFNLLRREENMLVQGVVDCAFLEGGSWVIVDYKTDRVEDEGKFTEVYRPQLEWYAKALRELTGKEVKELWLWSISRQKAYRVK